MATRSRTTMKKREKELARAQKQRDKVAKRLARKNGLLTPGESDSTEAGDDGSYDSPFESETQSSSSLTTLP